MKKILLTLIVPAFMAFAPFTRQNEELAIGVAAPKADLKMPDVTGKSVSLNDVKGKTGTLVIFTCNTCPFVVAWEDRYNGLAELCGKNNIGIIAVNSNEAKREGDDSLEAMKTKAKEKSYTFTYVLDKGSELADAFGATRTPHIFLFDKNSKLIYKGAIDDNHEKADAVNKPYLRNALENLAAGKPIDPNTTRSVGCSIKRKA